jgi:hypothetical protein
LGSILTGILGPGIFASTASKGRMRLPVRSATTSDIIRKVLQRKKIKLASTPGRKFHFRFIHLHGLLGSHFAYKISAQM